MIENSPHGALNAIDLLSLPSIGSYERNVRKRVRRLWDEASGPAVPTQFHISYGDPARQIAAFARLYQSDLVILPSHGSAGQSRYALGTVAAKTVRRLATSLFFVKSFGRSLVEQPGETASDTRRPSAS